MTKRHFIKIAAITARISNDLTRSFVAHEQADLFAQFNDNFDRATYLRACNAPD